MNFWTPVLSILFCCFALTCQAQLQTIIHNEFPVDTAETVMLDLYGDYLVEPWPGNNILVETKIKLYNGSKSILSFFLQGDRYKIDYELNDKTITLTSKDKVRLPVRAKNGKESKEDIGVRIFIPDTFSEYGPGTWVKSF